jgi:large subunit ribosomal protein L29
MAQQQQSMADKVRNLTAAELHAREHDQSEQLFKLKFQMKMGQTESVKKLRELRKEIARIKTVAREKELGIARAAVPASPDQPVHNAKAKKVKKATAAKKTASAKPAKKAKKTTTKAKKVTRKKTEKK